MEDQDWRVFIGQALASVLENLAEMEALEEKKKAERIEAFEDMPEEEEIEDWEDWVDDWYASKDVPWDENEDGF
jgi:hypothetical protein